MNKTKKLISLLACSLMVIAAAGCNSSDRPPLGQITGNVKIKGQPVEHLYILFSPVPRGKAGVGETDAQGNYTVSFGNPDILGAPVGECVVSVTWPTGYEVPEGISIPEGWGSDSKTKVEVKPGKNEFNFDLE